MRFALAAASLALFENSRKFTLSLLQVASLPLPERLKFSVRVPEALLTDEERAEGGGDIETSAVDLVCLVLALGFAAVPLLDTNLSQFTVNNATGTVRAPGEGDGSDARRDCGACAPARRIPPTDPGR